MLALKELADFEELQNQSPSGAPLKPRLLQHTGGLMVGKPSSTLIQGTLLSVETHALPYEILSSDEITRRFPMMTPSSDEIGVYENQAGYLIPEACITAYCALAESYNATLHFNETVLTYTAIPRTDLSEPHNENDNSSIMKVTTDKGRVVYSKKVVVCVGAWAPELYGSSIPLPLRVERRVLFWLTPPDSSNFTLFQVCFHSPTYFIHQCCKSQYPIKDIDLV
jgi:sarcosine oxidase